MADEDLCGINKFVERDIDMLLAEEIRVNSDFSRWVLAKFDIAERFEHPAIMTNVSVVEDGSEADVIATFKTPSGDLHRLYVENKIDATLMPQQLERYVRRGEGEIRRGSVSGFSVLFVTPSSYRRTVLPPEVRQISFEEMAQHLRSSSDLRAGYRASLLSKAIPLASRGLRDANVSETDPYIKGWWDKVYEMLDREFPNFFIHKTLYPRSVYFAPETAGQGKYLRVDFKGHKGEVDLAFKNIPAEDLKVVLAKLEAVPGVLVPNGKSVALQISGLQPFVISDGYDVIDTKVRAAYQAAHDLLRFWERNQIAFDNVALSNGK